MCLILTAFPYWMCGLFFVLGKIRSVVECIKNANLFIGNRSFRVKRKGMKGGAGHFRIRKYLVKLTFWSLVGGAHGKERQET
jgi:hypothetical protein